MVYVTRMDNLDAMKDRVIVPTIQIALEKIQGAFQHQVAEPSLESLSLAQYPNPLTSVTKPKADHSILGMSIQ